MNTDVKLDSQGNYEMHNVEAVLMGAMALMSGYAQCGCNHKHMMAHKIVVNLSHLINQPELTAQFRMALGNLRTLWQNTIESEAQPTEMASAEREAKLWHIAPNAVQ